KFFTKITFVEILTIILTAVIAWSTTCYTLNSSRQLDTMERGLTDSEASESGRVQIEFDPEILDDGGNFAKISGDITVSNIGRTELSNVGALCTFWFSYQPPSSHDGIEPTDFPNGGTVY